MPWAERIFNDIILRGFLNEYKILIPKMIGEFLVQGGISQQKGFYRDFFRAIDTWGSKF